MTLIRVWCAESVSPLCAGFPLKDDTDSTNPDETRTTAGLSHSKLVEFCEKGQWKLVIHSWAAMYQLRPTRGCMDASWVHCRANLSYGPYTCHLDAEADRQHTAPLCTAVVAELYLFNTWNCPLWRIKQTTYHQNLTAIALYWKVRHQLQKWWNLWDNPHQAVPWSFAWLLYTVTDHPWPKSL